MDSLTFFIVVCMSWAAFAAGLAVGRWQARREWRRGPGARPMRLTALGYTSPILPAHSGAQLSQWELYAVSFAFHGNMIGFGYRQMRKAGLCRRAACETFTELLTGAGVLVARERSETTWAGGWGYPAFRAAVKNGRLTLPFPAGSPPPLNSAHVMAAQTAQRSAGSPGGTGAGGGR